MSHSLTRRQALSAFAAVAAGSLTARSSGSPRRGSALRGVSPIVIAHRGASGYAPELSLPAFTLAHAMRPAMIETDVVLTKDRVPINLHDLTLDRTTDVRDRFFGKNRARGDGEHYAADFTLDEIRSLTITGPRDKFVEPMPFGGRIPTLAELFELVLGLNQSTGRFMEVLVEVKDPAFHAEQGLAIDRPVLDVLNWYEMKQPGDGAIVQSFGLDYTRDLRLKHKTQLPLVWLIGKNKPETVDLDEIATWADGIGPNRDRAERQGGALVKEARSRGLAVYCWTFKNEPNDVARFAKQLNVDGIISDFPDVAAKAIKA